MTTRLDLENLLRQVARDHARRAHEHATIASAISELIGPADAMPETWIEEAHGLLRSLWETAIETNNARCAI